MKLGELKKITQSLPRATEATSQQNMYERIRALGFDPNTFYQELEMTSRYVDTHQDVSYANGYLHLHSHTFFELLYCRNNCGAEYLVGAERYRLQKGDIIFVPPGVSHRPMLPEHLSEPYKRYVLWLSAEFMERYAALFPYPFTNRHSSANMLRTDGTKWEFLGELFRSGVQESERQEDGWEAAVFGNTIILLTQIKRATEDRNTYPLEAEKPDLLDRIMAFVENNYNRNITIEGLAKQFFVSSSTVSHLFKEKMGVSFYRYVTQRRLIAAKSLIEKGILLEEVAAQTGFQDYSSFYRAFKNEFGISPRQYRNL